MWSEAHQVAHVPKMQQLAAERHSCHLPDSLINQEYTTLNKNNAEDYLTWKGSSVPCSQSSPGSGCHPAVILWREPNASPPAMGEYLGRCPE